MKLNPQEPVRRSVVEKRHNPIQTKQQLLNSVEIQRMNRNEFLNNVEQGSTLHGSRNPTSGAGNEATIQRIKSAHAGSGMRPLPHPHPQHFITHHTMGPGEREYTDSPGEVESRQCIRRSICAHMEDGRTSPLNTVFQKLVVHENKGQSRTQQVSAVQNNKPRDSNESKSLANVSELKYQHQLTQPQPQLIKPKMIMKRTMSKNSDQLLISVKPMNKGRPYGSGGSPSFDPQNSAYSQNAQPVYSSEESDMDDEESPMGNRTHLSNKCHNQNDQTAIIDANYMKDAGTAPMFAEEIGTQTMKQQTSYPTFEGAEGQIDNMTDFLNFYNSDLFQIGGGQRNSQKLRSQRVRSLKSIASNEAIKIDLTKVVAQVVPDRMIFGERQIERTLAGRGYNHERYICLFQRDLVWMHNYVVALLTRRRLEKATRGRLTTDGRKEHKRRHRPNPMLMRNSNLAPTGHNRLEKNTRRQIQDENKVFNDNYQHLVGLIKKGQDVIGRLPGVPLISVKKIINNPSKQLVKIAKLIKETNENPKQPESTTIDKNKYQTQPIADMRKEVSMTPPRTHYSSQQRILMAVQQQKLLDSEAYPPTVTMSHTMAASERQSLIGTDKVLKQVIPMHHLSIVTRVMEQRPPAPLLPKPFAHQNKPPVGAQGSSVNAARSFRHKSQGAKKKHIMKQHDLQKGMQSMLVVGQVKVNGQQNMTIGQPASDHYNKSFMSGQAVGTHRLANTSQLESQSEIGAGEGNQTVSFREAEHIRLMEKHKSSQECNVGLIIIEGDQNNTQRIQQRQQIEIFEEQYAQNEQSFCAKDSSERLLQLQQQQLLMAPQTLLNNTNESQRSKSDINMFSTDIILYGGQNAIENDNQYLFTQSRGLNKATQPIGNPPPISSFDMTAVLLEDYKEFMKNKAHKTINQKKRQSSSSEQRNAVWKKANDAGQKEQTLSTIVKHNNEVDEKSSITINTQQLNQIESRAVTTEQKMQANLYKEFHVMKKYMEEPDGVTGTKVKTFSGHPSDLFKRKQEEQKTKFSELKQNEIQVQQKSQPADQLKQNDQNKTKERRAQSAMQLHPHNNRQPPSQQRVILIKGDPYKPHEPTTENPIWSVPTNKRIIRDKQNRGTSLDSAKQKEEAVQSQANFYRTTRTAANYDSNGNILEHAESEQVLAIDHNNTINLQKVIDQYYDGDLTLDRNHNGDLHSMQMAQSEGKKQMKIKQQQEDVLNESEMLGSAKPDSTLVVDDDAVANGNGTCGSSMMNSKVVFSRDRSRRESQKLSEPPTVQMKIKMKLQGSKFKQSEMQGFRRIVSHIDQNTGVYTSSKKTSSIQVSQQGTVTIDSQEQMEKQQKNRKGIQNHQVDVGKIPNSTQRSRAGQNYELQPSTHLLMNEPTGDNHSNDTFGIKLSNQNSVGIPSQILSRRLKTPKDSDVQKVIDDYEGDMENPGLAHTLYKGVNFDLAAANPSFNKDLGQVIGSTENQISNSARSLTKGQKPHEFNANTSGSKPQGQRLKSFESDVPKSRREKQSSNSPCKDTSSLEKGPYGIATEAVDNFGVAGERIKEQSRVQPSHFATSSKAFKQKKSLILQDYQCEEEESLKKPSRNLGDKETSGSVDLRTLTRGESHIMSTSLDIHTGMGRTPVNINNEQVRVQSAKVLGDKTEGREDVGQKKEEQVKILVTSYQAKSKESKTGESDSVNNRCFELNEEVSPDKKKDDADQQQDNDLVVIQGSNDRPQSGVVFSKKQQRRRESKKQKGSSESLLPGKQKDSGEIESQHSSMGASPELDRNVSFLAKAIYERDQRQPTNFESRSLSASDVAAKDKTKKEQKLKSNSGLKETTPTPGKRAQDQLNSRSHISQRKRSDNRYNNSNEGKSKLPQKEISAQNMILFSVPTVASQPSNRKDNNLQKSPDKKGRNFTQSSSISPAAMVKPGGSGSSKKQVRSQSARRKFPIQQSGERMVNITKLDSDKGKTETIEIQNQESAKFMDVKPMKSTASHHKEQGETFDSEKLRGRDFKLVESELDEEVADEMEDCVHISRGEMTLLKSPIHVKTVTVSKLENSRTQLNAEGHEIGNRNKSLPHADDTSMTDVSINAIGMAAYPAQKEVNGRTRPVTTVGGRREAYRMGQVHIIEEQDPYMSFLQNGETGMDSLLGNGSKKHRLFGSQTSEALTQTGLVNNNGLGHATTSTQFIQNRRPKSSIQSINQVSRQLKAVQLERGHSAMLKRNMSMNRRKQELLEKAQATKQKRNEKLNRRDLRQFTTVAIPRPNLIHNTTAQSEQMAMEEDSKMQGIYSMRKRSGQEALNCLTAFSTQQLPEPIEEPMQTVYASQQATPEGDLLSRRQSQQASKVNKPLVKETAVLLGSRNMNDQNPKVIVLHDSDNNLHKGHNRTNTRQLIEVAEDSPRKNQMRTPREDATNFNEKSQVSKVTVSQSFTKLSQTRSTSSMQAIPGVSELMQLNQLKMDQSTDRECFQDYNQCSPSKEITIPNMMKGKPVQGCAEEIWRKREKMKELYKVKRPAVGTNYKMASNRMRQLSSLSKRPPTGLSNRRAASTLESSMGINASMSNFSVQGSSLTGQRMNLNPYSDLNKASGLLNITK